MKQFKRDRGRYERENPEPDEESDSGSRQRPGWDAVLHRLSIGIVSAILVLAFVALSVGPAEREAAASASRATVIADQVVSSEEQLERNPGQAATSETCYLAVAGDVFRPRSSEGVEYTAAYASGGAYISAGSETMMLAPLHLPDGATITEFRAFFYDHSPLDLVARIQGYSPSGSYATLATVDSSQVSGSGDPSVTGLSHEIDNRQVLYELSVYSSGGDWSTAGSDLRIKGVVIGFTVSGPCS